MMHINISVVIPFYRRIETINKVVESWKKLVPARQIWVCDSSPFKLDMADVNVVKFNIDPGNKTRHSVALLTEGDFVIKADDDLIPLPGIIDDFLIQYNAVNGGIFGVIGRIFNGISYYKNTSFCRASKLTKPHEVDFVGVMTFSPRRYLAFDLRGCLTPIEDLFWQMKAYPNVRKYVVASAKYRNLPACNDGKDLFHNPKARKIRERFYGEYYKLYYQNRES